MSILTDLTIQTRNMKEVAKLIAEEEFDNPEIQDDPVERLNNAVTFVKLRGWSINKSSKKLAYTGKL